jgi:ubiquitin C-terminal hydrolase
MLHRGGAYGGHYSAFIKDMEGDTEDSWYHFNDSIVSKISVVEVADAFGGSKGMQANYANAYMLMYRLCETIQKSSLEDIPEEVKADIIESLEV